jgi:hypothetical protein
MPTFQSLHHHHRRGIPWRDGIGRQLPRCRRVPAARTPNVQRPLFFAVEVKQRQALHETGLKVVRAVQSHFFVNGEEELQRSVLERLVFHDGKICCDSDPIIRTERSPICHQNISLADELERIFVKIMDSVLVLFADHIQVPLETDHGSLVSTTRCRLANDHVHELILLRFQPEFFCRLHDVGCDGLFVL